MKVSKTFQVAVLAIIMATILAGCASDSFRRIKDPIIIGDKEYTALLTERVQPWGTSATTLSLVESELEQNAPPTINQQDQVVQYQQVQNVSTRTHIANSNNQGSAGWAGSAFNGAVGSSIIGGSMVWAAGRIRPSTVTATGGSSSASACSSASAAAAASGQ